MVKQNGRHATFMQNGKGGRLGKGKGCICVRACMDDVGYNGTWGCTRRLQVRSGKRDLLRR